ncbi:MAG: hypothetical protein QM762_00850 [Chryseolinea sp.]
MTPLETYPFLVEIPDQLLRTIDLSVLYIPTEREEEILCKLERDLNTNIVIYRKDAVSNGTHLCRVLRFASLTEQQLHLLNAVETLFHGQVIVAYDNPLRIVRS